MSTAAAALGTCIIAGFFGVLPAGWAQPPVAPLEAFRKLRFPPKDENFDQGWKERVLAEFDVVNSAQLESLRAALKNRDPFVRAIAVRALGIRSDKASADAIALLAKDDPEYLVRIRAVEALGFLRMHPETIERARKDRQAGVQWSAMMAAGQLKCDTDHAALARKAYAKGMNSDELGVATVGKRAPDFVAQTSEGKDFKLSSVLGKKPIALYFAAFDG